MEVGEVYVVAVVEAALKGVAYGLCLDAVVFVLSVGGEHLQIRHRQRMGGSGQEIGLRRF
jgi:hypothetical protein